MFLPDFYLPKGLYKDEREVRDALAKINSTGRNIDQQIYKMFKRIVDKILTHANKTDYHPLDYPIVRYFLQPDLSVINLPSVQRPEFIKQFAQEFDGGLADSFFREITAETPDKFYIALESLSAEWYCIQYLKANGAQIYEFHQKSGGGKRDIRFQLNGTEWIAEAKCPNHEDINLYCVAQMLAGMMWLEEEGKKLRDCNHITLKGHNIGDVFRAEVIKFLRNKISEILSIVENMKKPCIKKKMNGFKVSIYARPKKIKINSDKNSNSYLRMCLGKNSGHSLYYRISPLLAYSWPEPLNSKFYNKLDTHLKRMEEQKRACSNYLGFLHVELADKYSDSQKCLDEEQEWEQAIRTQLNQKDFPVALHTLILVGHQKVPRELLIVNKAAKDAGFTEKTQVLPNIND